MFPRRPPASCRLRPPAALLLLLLSASLPCQARRQTIQRSLAPGILYTQEILAGATPQIINVLQVDPKAPGVTIRYGQARDAITLDGPTRGREGVPSLSQRNGARAAVNADFFPFTGDPLGLAIRDGELLSEPSEHRACIGIGPDGILMDVLVPIGSLRGANGVSVALDGINRIPEDGESVLLTPAYAATPKLPRPAIVLTVRDVNLPVRVSQEMRGTIEAISTLAAGDALPAVPSGGALLAASGEGARRQWETMRPGEAVQFRFDLTPNLPPPPRGQFPSRAFMRGRSYIPVWKNVRQAVSGGPWLVRDGQVRVDGEAQGFSQAAFVNKRHPRTAIGATADGKLLLVTVDGRQERSSGASLPELAEILRRYGAVNAINLDGGGSTTMVVNDGVVNAPSEGRIRPVANALLIYGDAPRADAPETLQLRAALPNAGAIPAGASVAFQVTDASGAALPPETPVLWGTRDGLGFIDQQGVFTSHRAGKGSVIARIGARRLEAAVTVLGGSPAKLTAAFSPVPNNPPDRLLLTVTVRDRFGNPVPNARIAAAARGGVAASPLLTDTSGRAMTEIVWDVPAGQRVVTVSIGSAPPVTLRQ